MLKKIPFYIKKNNETTQKTIELLYRVNDSIVENSKASGSNGRESFRINKNFPTIRKRGANLRPVSQNRRKFNLQPERRPPVTFRFRKKKPAIIHDGRNYANNKRAYIKTKCVHVLRGVKGKNGGVWGWYVAEMQRISAKSV